ncbi:MAG: hypothetical protein AB1938_24695 [Myxococcota bacterium]
MSTPGLGCGFATARYFASRPLSPDMMDVPSWLPHDDVGGILLAISAGEVAPLEVLADAGVALVLDGGGP